MTTYPGAIDEFRETQNLPGITYDSEDTTTVYAEDTNDHSDAIVAIETTLGVEPQGDSDTVADRLASLEALIATLDDRYYPVGSIYGNGSNSTNPATLLGFGVWQVYSQGRVIAGKSASGKYSAVGNTFGVDDVTLTTAQIPAHRHRFSPLANTVFRVFRQSAAGVKYTVAFNQDFTEWNLNTDDVIQETGGGEAHTNNQPTIVAALWRRIA